MPLPATQTQFEFVRWLAPQVDLMSEPGGGEAVGSTTDDLIAAVVGRTVVDGVEWIRVQVGRDSGEYNSTYVWAPLRTGSIARVYEPVIPHCPVGEPTLYEIGGWLPAHKAFCFGSRTLTFSPLQVRDEGSEEAQLTDGKPAWLVEGGNLVMHWLPEARPNGALRLFVDPASGITVPKIAWVEISGHFDDPAAGQCNRTSDHPRFQLDSPDEAVMICRGRFVVTGVRQLSEAEIPVPSPHATPGPSPEHSIPVAVRRIEPPFATRISASGVWTGSELLVWGGWRWEEDADITPQADGAAYDPRSGTWRGISAAPIRPRGAHAAAWTGTEMLVWGGYNRGLLRAEGAAYDPATDTWRAIDPGPLRASYQVASVWTGAEWWVAVTRQDRIHVAAYDPSADSWRQLPAPTGRAGDGTELVWTGSEVLLMNSNTGLLRMAPQATEWTNEPVDFHGRPLAWTGELLIGSRTENVATDPFEWEPWSYPVAWDPQTRNFVDIPHPPHTAGDPLWTGNLVSFFGSGLALDLEAGEWRSLEIEELSNIDSYREDAVKVWAGDRLLVWGGWTACPGYVDGFEVGYELIPALPSAYGESNVGASPFAGSSALVGAGSGGALAPPPTESRTSFAC